MNGNWTGCSKKGNCPTKGNGWAIMRRNDDHPVITTVNSIEMRLRGVGMDFQHRRMFTPGTILRGNLPLHLPDGLVRCLAVALLLTHKLAHLFLLYQSHPSTGVKAPEICQL